MLANRFAYLDLTGFGEDILHPEHLEYAPVYKRIRDCLDNRVKEQGQEYLLDPSEGIVDQKIRDMRYKHYLARACFVPVTRRTRDGLVAQVLMRKPKVIVPKDAPDLLKRVTSKGTSIQSLASTGLGEAVSFGRCGFLVGYSDVSKRPFIDLIQPEDIITWAELPAGMTDDIDRNIGSVTVRLFHDVLDTDGVSIRKIAQLTQYTLSSQGVVWARTKQSQAGTGSRTTKWT